MKRSRSHDFDWDDFPVVGGTGTLCDLAPNNDPPLRLHGMKSVSPAAAYALQRQNNHRANPIGFRTRFGR